MIDTCFSATVTVAYDASSGSRKWMSKDAAPGTSIFSRAIASPDGERIFVTAFGGRPDFVSETIALDATTGVEVRQQSGSKQNGPYGASRCVRDDRSCGILFGSRAPLILDTPEDRLRSLGSFIAPLRLLVQPLAEGEDISRGSRVRELDLERMRAYGATLSEQGCHDDPGGPSELSMGNLSRKGVRAFPHPGDPSRVIQDRGVGAAWSMA